MVGISQPPGRVSNSHGKAKRRPASRAAFWKSALSLGTRGAASLPISGLPDLDLGAGGLDLLLDLLGFGLGDAFLDGLGRSFDEGLGFRQAEAGDGGADFLDDADLV